MSSIFKRILIFFKTEKTVYSHRNRTIEVIAREKNIDINSIQNDTKAVLESEGSVEAVMSLRKRFKVPLVSAWIFVERLKNKKDTSGTGSGLKSK